MLGGAVFPLLTVLAAGGLGGGFVLWVSGMPIPLLTIAVLAIIVEKGTGRGGGRGRGGPQMSKYEAECYFQCNTSV